MKRAANKVMLLTEMTLYGVSTMTGTLCSDLSRELMLMSLMKPYLTSALPMSGWMGRRAGSKRTICSACKHSKLKLHPAGQEREEGERREEEGREKGGRRKRGRCDSLIC